MILSENENCLAKEIFAGNFSVQNQNKTLNLKRVSTFINKLKHPSTLVDSLLKDLCSLDVSKFMDDVVETLLLEFKSQDASKFFLLYIQLSRDYPEVREVISRRIGEIISEENPDIPKLKLFLKFLYLCDEYNISIIEYTKLIDTIYKAASRFAPNDFLNFLGFIHKYISLSSNEASLSKSLTSHFCEFALKLLSEINCLTTQLNVQVNRLINTFENRGDISATATSEFLALYNELDLKSTMYLKIGGEKSKIRNVDLQGLIIEDGKRLKVLDYNGTNNEFDSKEEECFYTVFPQIESAVESYSEDVFLKKILEMNYVEDSDVAYGYVKNALAKNQSEISECILKCCRLSNQRIPLICRVIARLSHENTDFAGNIRESVFNQGASLLKLKHSAPGLRFRVCSVFCELAKFGVFEIGTLYRYLFMCCDAFDANAVEMICIILENCGRFLISRKDDKRLDNLLKVLQSKLKDSKKPSNCYKVVHILSYFVTSESNETSTPVDSLQYIESFLLTVDSENFSDADFHVLISTIPLIESFSNEQLGKIASLMFVLKDPLKIFLLEHISEFFQYLIDVKSFQVCFSLIGLFNLLCPRIYRYETMLNFFSDIKSSICLDQTDKSQLAVVLSEAYSRIFASSHLNVEARSILMIDLDIPKPIEPRSSKQNETSNAANEKEFEEAYSKTIKTDLSQCLNKRPLKKKLPTSESLKNEMDPKGLRIITSTKKKPKDLP